MRKRREESNRKGEPILRTAAEMAALHAEFVRRETKQRYRAHAPKCVQPDYARWNSIQIGMSQAEVIALLGEPIERYRGRMRCPPNFLYGYIDLSITPSPFTYEFSIQYDSEEKVLSKTDPFQGETLPLDGRPSEPSLIVPQDGAQFNHLPWLLDIRWNPCSGQYPIQYTVELGWHASSDREWRVEIAELGLLSPYCVVRFPGSSQGRIRVRGHNAIGDGDWSDYRYFSFRLPR